MPCTAKKTFATAATTGNALLVRVKDNQPRLLESLAGLCAEREPVDRHETADRGRHGRQEHRRVEVFAVADQLPPPLCPRLRSFALNILRAGGVGNVSEAVYVNALSLDQLLAYGLAKSKN